MKKVFLVLFTLILTLTFIGCGQQSGETEETLAEKSFSGQIAAISDGVGIVKLTSTDPLYSEYPMVEIPLPQGEETDYVPEIGDEIEVYYSTISQGSPPQVDAVSSIVLKYRAQAVPTVSITGHVASLADDQAVVTVDRKDARNQDFPLDTFTMKFDPSAVSLAVGDRIHVFFEAEKYDEAAEVKEAHSVQILPPANWP